jgi:hypothetical protein
MSEGFVIRHVVSIAGCVREQARAETPPSPRDGDRRLAGALIEIIAGPPEFDRLVTTWALDPARRGARPGRTISQADGIYFFTDLPPGAYRLRVSAPQHGSRFGTVETGEVGVPPAPASGQPVAVRRVDVDLPSTRVRGVVTRSDSGASVPGGLVRVRGDPQTTHTDEAGRYELRHLVQGSPTMEISAPNLVSTRRTVQLSAGQEQVLDIQLDPAL